MPESPDPGDRAPAQARLAHPPSDRYRAVPAEAEHPERKTSLTLGFAAGSAAAILSAAVFTLLAGGLAFDVGLLVAAVFAGWLVAQAVRWGAGSVPSRRLRIGLAVALALVGLTLGELGTWLWARSQGGDLALVDHLWTTYGPIFPLEYALALIASAWSAR